MHSATGGRRAGFAVVCGLVLGVLVHTLAALQLLGFGLFSIVAAVVVLGVVVMADLPRGRLAHSACSTARLVVAER